MAALCRELDDALAHARLEKVHQPGERELVLTLRTRRQGTVRLRLSADRSAPTAHLLFQTRPVNPDEPPMFCMLVRRRLEGARVVDVRQLHRDRIVAVRFEGFNDLGDRVHLLLVLELMGKHSNLLLCSADAAGEPQQIVDSIVRVPPDVSRVRPVLPGLAYSPPPPQDKQPLAQVTAGDLEPAAAPGLDERARIRAICARVAGVGPVTAREALFRAGLLSPAEVRGAADPLAEAHRPLADAARLLWSALTDLANRAQSGLEPACVGLDALGRPVTAAPFRLTSQPHRSVPTFNEALDAVHAEAAKAAGTSAMARELNRVVRSQIDKLQAKLAKIAEMEQESQDHEQLRIKGELLITYADAVRRGMERVQLPNYYDGDQLLEIALDPALTAVENAQRYFKLSSKRKRAIPILAAERAAAEADLRYLEDVLVHLYEAPAERLWAIREELEQQGFLRRSQRRRASGKDRQEPARDRPDQYVSRDGFTIRVGRSNLQNDRLTLRQSRPHDIWLHVKDQPGAHVIVQSDGRDVPDTTLHDAALLAAYFSKARHSANVAVDYTKVKHVWKPNGARPGQVLYEGHRTLYVTPDRERVQEILQRTP